MKINMERLQEVIDNYKKNRTENTTASHDAGLGSVISGFLIAEQIAAIHQTILDEVLSKE